jgi:pimeloyl-ACP methyl ester carboxylesterase
MGEEDHMFLPPVKQIVQRHKFATLQILNDSGHVVNVDQPELFNAHTIAFIKRHS